MSKQVFYCYLTSWNLVSELWSVVEHGIRKSQAVYSFYDWFSKSHFDYCRSYFVVIYNSLRLSDQSNHESNLIVCGDCVIFMRHVIRCWKSVYRKWNRSRCAERTTNENCEREYFGLLIFKVENSICFYGLRFHTQAALRLTWAISWHRLKWKIYPK